MLEWPIFVTVAIWPVVFAVYGLYDLRRPTHATAEFQRLFNGDRHVRAARGADHVHRVPIEISRELRLCAAGRLPRHRRYGQAGHPPSRSHAQRQAVTSQLTLIAGTNDEARALARTLMRRPWMGYRVCGFVEVDEVRVSR